jgi:cyclopropane fatty-acyl-phospholipid synthase-like methyltransferase
MSEVAPIATMPLYTNVDRIAKGLAALGIGPTDPIQPEQLFAMDQWHYHGTDAIRDTAKRLALGPKDQVLDVGSGVGGPARYLAHTIGCHVTALELQPELHEIAVDLTRRCALDRLVTHVCADALTYPLTDASFDAWVSWLAILHIPDRPRLLARLRRALRPGGRCHIEDLCMRATFAPRDLNDVRQIVHGNVVTTIADYKADLEAAGFVDVVTTDLTPDWAPYAAERLTAWKAGHAAYVRVHGETAYAAQDLFYTVIARLYESGSLGGVRLQAKVP